MSESKGFPTNGHGGPAGYLYALVNPSFPGFVKVGKTTRDPKARCQELSSATGVPTPFVLVHQCWTLDCGRAEGVAHAKLGAQGKRINGDREFFEADLGEVKRVLNAACSWADANSGDSPEDLNRKAILEDRWRVFFELYEDELPDYERAIEVGEEIAAFGDSGVLFYLGDIHERTVGKNGQKLANAERCLRDAIKASHNYCYYPLARVLAKQGRERESEIAWSRFFEIYTDASTGEDQTWYRHGLACRFDGLFPRERPAPSLGRELLSRLMDVYVRYAKGGDPSALPYHEWFTRSLKAKSGQDPELQNLGRLLKAVQRVGSKPGISLEEYRGELQCVLDGYTKRSVAATERTLDVKLARETRKWEAEMHERQSIAEQQEIEGSMEPKAKSSEGTVQSLRTVVAPRLCRFCYRTLPRMAMVCPNCGEKN